MKIILSPAKSLNEEATCKKVKVTQPAFVDESARLVKTASKLSERQLGKLMSISPELAELNVDRFKRWTSRHTESNSVPAAYLFTGAAYLGLDYPSLSVKEQNVGQEKLRILSGLYGLLKPLDLVQPYRLEMGTRLKVTPKVSNLYIFWGDKIRKALETELELDKSPVLVNLASSEYFKAVQLKDLQSPVITPVFKDKNKNGEYRVNMMYAKMCRGRMSRFIIQNDLNDAEDLKAFKEDGYKFSRKESDKTTLVFLRA